MKINIKKRSSGYATIAMADIAFLLLVFLILTVSIDDNGDIQLPFFNNSKPLSTSNSIVISIDKNSTIKFEDDFLYLQNIEDTFSGYNRKSSVVKVIADKDVNYIEVDRVINSFHDIGFIKIILSTEDRQ